jgi:hypothetical protein
MMTESGNSIQTHYRSTDLLGRILAGLREAGRNPDAPTIEDLAPADEFHSLGRVATKELAALAALEPGTRVLDVGSGLGGPARYLAVACGFRAARGWRSARDSGRATRSRCRSTKARSIARGPYRRR